MAKGKCEDVVVYEELKEEFGASAQLMYDVISLGVFTEAYRALRKAMHEESKNLSSIDVEEFAEKAIEANNVLRDYESVMFSIANSIQKNIESSISLENGDVLDNAFYNFLKLNPVFTLRELMKYFEERYSEKRLIKYVGNIPLYKTTLIFDKNEIESRLMDLVHEGVVMSCSNKASSKGKKKEYSAKLDRDTFISMPVLYALFSGSWNPLAIYPEIEQVREESCKVLRELMDGEFEPNQANRILKLMFKDAKPESVLGNFAGILSMYYEQMNEPRPDYIVETEHGPMINIESIDSEMYETVKV